MKTTEWRSLAVILAGTLAAGCGKDSTGPGGDSNTPPVANFTSSCTDLVCTFTNLSVDPDGNLTAYDWSFGDGGNGSSWSPSHTYNNGGEYSVTLKVTDNSGDNGTTTKAVTVTVPGAPGAPTANFSVTCSSLDCTFHDLSSDADGTVVGWAWDFGDGTQSSEQNPSVHHFNASSLSTLTATLTVTDNDGLTSTKSAQFTVSPAATLQCEDAPGTGHWSSCDLVLDADASVTVTLQSAECTAHGNTFQITGPVAQTLFTDGCYSPATPHNFNLDNGGSAVFPAGTHLSAQIISGSLKQVWPPAIHVTGSYPQWTLSFDDGEGEAGGAPPDFNDLVLTVTAHN